MFAVRARIKHVQAYLRRSPAFPGEAGREAVGAACTQLTLSVCCGEQSNSIKCGPRRCVNIGCCDELKHNCVAHLCEFEAGQAPRRFPAASRNAVWKLETPAPSAFGRRSRALSHSFNPGIETLGPNLRCLKP